MSTIWLSPGRLNRVDSASIAGRGILTSDYINVILYATPGRVLTTYWHPACDASRPSWMEVSSRSGFSLFLIRQEAIRAAENALAYVVVMFSSRNNNEQIVVMA